MLQLLHIENIAIIERADIAFAPGFNALTGETGAGKSIVIDSLGAVLGQRTSRDLIRTGTPKAFVSAVFDHVDGALPALAENGVSPEADGTLLLSRELYGDGKNVCRANGRPITVAQLKSIGASLLNIHGQHDGTQLLDETQHLGYLDRFGRTEAQLAAYTARYGELSATRREIAALRMAIGTPRPTRALSMDLSRWVKPRALTSTPNCSRRRSVKAAQETKLTPWLITVASAAPPAPMSSPMTNSRSSATLSRAATLMNTNGCFESPMPRSTALTAL